MKLSFHGAQYEYHPAQLEVVEGGTGGIYRGSPWKIHRVIRFPRRQQPSAEMVYRGVHYHHS